MLRYLPRDLERRLDPWPTKGSRQGRIGFGLVSPDLSPFSNWEVSGEIAGRKTVVFRQSVRGHEPIRISKGKIDDRRNPKNEENGKRINGQVCPRHLI